MEVEHLAMLGIAIFSFMAITALYGAIRSYRRERTAQRKPLRVRRLIGGKESARAVARSIVTETATKLEKELAASRQAGHLTEPLEEALNEARAYYLSRVEPIHRELFTQTVEEIVFEKGNVTKD